LIKILADLIDHPALLQGIEKSKYHRLRQSATGGDFLERQGLPGRTKHTKKLRRVNDGLDEVSVSSQSGGAHTSWDIMIHFSDFAKRNFKLLLLPGRRVGFLCLEDKAKSC
jgi:hypothetical protein